MAFEVPHLSLEKLAVLQRLLGPEVEGRVAMWTMSKLPIRDHRRARFPSDAVEATPSVGQSVNSNRGRRQPRAMAAVDYTPMGLGIFACSSIRNKSRAALLRIGSFLPA